MKYVKSPLNYIGGKYKLLSQIIPLIPTDIKCFVDLFGGGFNIGANVNCQNIIYNDVCIYLVDLLKNFYTHTEDYIHEKTIKFIEKYKLSRTDINSYEFYGCNSNDGLSKYNGPQYRKLREDYNRQQDWIRFYILILYSFNNQIRFNSNGQFNMPCGKRDYNLSLQRKEKSFLNVIHNKNIAFINNDFREYHFSQGDFIYCDPPYFNSVATYIENGLWDINDEKDLLSFLNTVDKSNGRFALSNNLKYDNPLLYKWKDKYNIHFLNTDYSNCNYHKINKSKDIEVLITNY